MGESATNANLNDSAGEVVPGPAEDYSGRVLGDFELIRRIGMGGMGQVYLAKQLSLKRQVAIKILKNELSANTTSLRRFHAEAEAVASITHANIVQVYAIGQVDQLHYMALEYVDGRNLRDYLEKKGTPDLPQALEMMRQVASALERASELGFVHRDIKPENILISKKGEVKVTDFGLSRAFSSDAPLNLTQSGVAMGTPLYMSPEQVRGQPVDPRSDIYSFGVTCYHMIGGEPPFKGSAAFDVALQHVQAEPRPLKSMRPDLPDELCAIIHKMMAKKPEERYQSASLILADLGRLRERLGAGISGAQFTPGQFVAGLGASSTSVSAVPSGAQSTFYVQRFPVWRWVAVGVLALIAGGIGAAFQWVQKPVEKLTNPEAALNDLDPAPGQHRAEQIKAALKDKSLKETSATDLLLELAQVYIKERQFDDALKLFENESVRKLPPFEAIQKDPKDFRGREQINVMCALGRGIVYAHHDKATESVEEFRKLCAEYPAILDPKKDRPDAKTKDIAKRGVIEAFFRNNSAVNWKKAINEAIERDSKNLGGNIPSAINRLRSLPGKGPLGKS